MLAMIGNTHLFIKTFRGKKSMNQTLKPRVCLKKPIFQLDAE